MPDHAGDRGVELLVLEPHDHLHINQIRASGSARLLGAWGLGTDSGQRTGLASWGSSDRTARRGGGAALRRSANLATAVSVMTASAKWSVRPGCAWHSSLRTLPSRGS